MNIETKYFSKNWFLQLTLEEKAALILSISIMAIYTVIICLCRTVL